MTTATTLRAARRYKGDVIRDMFEPGPLDACSFLLLNAIAGACSDLPEMDEDRAIAAEEAP